MRGKLISSGATVSSRTGPPPGGFREEEKHADSQAKIDFLLWKTVRVLADVNTLDSPLRSQAVSTLVGCSLKAVLRQCP